MAELIDQYGRRLNYLRISVTDRCNFRCTYCMPAEGVPCLSHEEILRYEDIKFLCRVFTELGVVKFRFTGGEPLVRKGLVPFLKELREELPGIKIALTTNASLLGEYAGALAQAKIDSLNISLDTLDPEKFASVTRTGKIEAVLAGIRAAGKAGIKNIKLNTVLVRGFNDHEICELLKFARENGLLLRLIEFMPIEDGIWDKSAYISGEEILSMLPGGGKWEKTFTEHKDADGPAEYYRNEKSGDRIGIITAVSNHFCKNCNRLRISAEGSLRSCLFNPRETALKEIIRMRDPAALREAILRAVSEKPRCWNDVKTGSLHMSGIGG
ncbi:MAG: GTP 3',8-cyclase MoaA [Synergistaceae bacterium]|nr:GTP 3',8-cyclase MoaA [Synergistaceae bacterium]